MESWIGLSGRWSISLMMMKSCENGFPGWGVFGNASRVCFTEELRSFSGIAFVASFHSICDYVPNMSVHFRVRSLHDSVFFFRVWIAERWRTLVSAKKLLQVLFMNCEPRSAIISSAVPKRYECCRQSIRRRCRRCIFCWEKFHVSMIRYAWTQWIFHRACCV